MHGYEAWLQADFNRSAPITHTLKALHVDDGFDLNDLGYMERNALEQIEWETNRRVAAVDGGPVNGRGAALVRVLPREHGRRASAIACSCRATFST